MSGPVAAKDAPMPYTLADTLCASWAILPEQSPVIPLRPARQMTL
jgi:hypothetical protein